MDKDAAYSGSIPERYDTLLVPTLFAPFAADMVREAVTAGGADILEIAAGTGAVTERLAAQMPDARIVATDLNPDMAARGEALHGAPNVAWRVADAQGLPFADASFDLVLCQFGVMFFPDRVAAYREMRRVLRPGGTCLFNCWDAIALNAGSNAVHCAYRDVLPEPKPAFLDRTPYGYHDRALIARELAAAGFGQVDIESVTASCPPGSGEALLEGLVEGSPLGREVAQHSPELVAAARDAARAALRSCEAAGPLAMAALRVRAR